MGKIEQIKKAIEDAENGISKLTPEVMSIGGYTSNKIRHVLNNLGSISTNYMEIGVHRGATFISTIYGNHFMNMKLAIDNFSELDEDYSVKRDFIKNTQKLGLVYNFIEQDCFTVNYLQVNNKPDLYFYDGNHSFESQKNALIYFYNYFPDELIFCCDDYQWLEVKKGTQEGIKECKLEVLYEIELGMEVPSDHYGYWNGFYVALLKKTV